MKYAVYFKYEAKVVVEAENPEQAADLAWEVPIDYDDIYYMDDYEVEEVVE